MLAESQDYLRDHSFSFRFGWGGGGGGVEGWFVDFKSKNVKWLA